MFTWPSTCIDKVIQKIIARVSCKAVEVQNKNKKVQRITKVAIVRNIFQPIRKLNLSAYSYVTPLNDFKVTSFSLHLSQQSIGLKFFYFQTFSHFKSSITYIIK